MSKIHFSKSPFRLIVGIYFILTFLFSLLYLLPQASRHGLSFLEAWFLSASAISVTGLSTITIAEELTWVGKGLLLLQIQIGGMGIMVILGVFLMLFTQSISLSQQTLMSFDQNQNGLKSVKKLILFILLFTLGVEFVGFLAIFPVVAQSTSGAEAVFKSVFHAVASFTNAGFDLFGGDLTTYSGNAYFLMISAGLIFAGAIGFPTVLELLFSKGKKKSLYTKVNITGHTVLIFFGFLVFVVLEWGRGFGSMNGLDKTMNALFLSVASRNGGLASIGIEQLTLSSLLLLMMLMFIGGSASSAAGGIRVTTFVVLFAKLRSVIKGQEEVVLFKKSVHEEDVNKSFLVFFVFFSVFLFSSFVLLLVEPVAPVALLFEIMSAMTTTGFSIGITADLSTFSLVWLSFLMILGRIGIIAMVYSLVKPKKANTRYVKEHVIVG